MALHGPLLRVTDRAAGSRGSVAPAVADIDNDEGSFRSVFVDAALATAGCAIAWAVLQLAIVVLGDMPCRVLSSTLLSRTVPLSFEIG
jgi:hypothetical protein